MVSRSQKSQLSPSLTKKGEGGIDLRKNEAGGVDMGRKSEPSVSASGIGLTREVGNIGGLTVTGGMSVDISPIDVGISGHPSFENPEENAVSISGGAEIPGGILGVSGGITINTNTGAVESISIGGEAGGLGVNVSVSPSGDVGIEFSYQLPFTPIEISIGFGSPPKEPTPGSGTSAPFSPFPPGPFPPPPLLSLPPTGDNTYCVVILSLSSKMFLRAIDGYQESQSIKVTGSVVRDERGYLQVTASRSSTVSSSTKGSKAYVYPSFSSYLRWQQMDSGVDFAQGIGGIVGIAGSQSRVYEYVKYYHNHDIFSTSYFTLERAQTFSVIYSDCPLSATLPPQDSSSSAPQDRRLFPSSPPRKNNMDQCCADAVRLARENKRFLQELMIMFGRPLNAKGDLIPIPPEAKYFGEEIERIKTPIEDIKNPEKEKIKFNNYYQLQMYLLRQHINLDVAVDPQSFVAPSGKLQNPNYERDSETSLETNIQPDEDKKGNKRELEIGEDIKINSFVQQQEYLFKAIRRLEYLFPAGELADARFEKSLIIPGATGELQIHNLIHFKEFLVQFLNATLGNPKIPVKIEDSNALKDGKQEASFNHFSISQMLRELYKIVLESGDDINSLMETTIRDFRTNLANRIQIVQIAEMAQALVEDTGMLEDQVFIPLKLDGDPYAGKWKAGVGFEPDADLDSNTEAATEKLMRATLNNFEAQVKVIRRDKRENADTRDLLLQLAEMFIRSSAIPATKEGIEKALAAAKFKVKVDNAISRSQVKRAAAAKLSRTKKKRK